MPLSSSTHIESQKGSRFFQLHLADKFGDAQQEVAYAHTNRGEEIRRQIIDKNGNVTNKSLATYFKKALHLGGHDKITLAMIPKLKSDFDDIEDVTLEKGFFKKKIVPLVQEARSGISAENLAEGYINLHDSHDKEILHIIPGLCSGPDCSSPDKYEYENIGNKVLDATEQQELVDFLNRGNKAPK